MLSVNISDMTIITIKNVDYRCLIHNIHNNRYKRYVLHEYEHSSSNNKFVSPQLFSFYRSEENVY